GGLVPRSFFVSDRLTLGAWHGFNDFLLNRTFRFGAMEFAFGFDGTTHLEVLFDYTHDGFRALRLSNDPPLPPVEIRGLSSGRFLETRVLDLPALALGWHRAALRRVPEGLELHVDDHRLILGAETDQEQTIG